jgi:hypothetical protein
MAGAAEAEDALLRAGLLLVPPRAADGGVEAVQVERLLQRLRPHDAHVQLGAMGDRPDAAGEAVRVGVDEEAEAELGDAAVAESQHLAEVPAGGDVQQREGRPARREGLHRHVQHTELSFPME